jgi:hypothetical protein
MRDRTWLAHPASLLLLAACGTARYEPPPPLELPPASAPAEDLSAWWVNYTV